MAHEIDMSNNRANIAFVGDTPWHNLGFRLLPDTSIDQWRIAAGLNWEVTKAVVKFALPTGEDVVMEDRIGLYRSDTKTPLSVMGQNYNIVQPGQILEFYRDLVAHHGFTLETAGSLKGGKRIWALAKVDQAFSLGKDLVHNYLLFATSFDGTMATVVKNTSVRVVCNNTLELSMTDIDNTIRIPHSVKFDPRDVKANFLGLEKDWKEFEENARHLSQRIVSRQEAVEYFVNLLYGNRDEVNLDDARVQKRLNKVVNLFEHAPGTDLPSAKQTAWGLVNAVTRFVDHEAGRTRSTALDSAWFGQGNKLKTQAWETAKKLAA